MSNLNALKTKYKQKESKLCHAASLVHERISLTWCRGILELGRWLLNSPLPSCSALDLFRGLYFFGFLLLGIGGGVGGHLDDLHAADLQACRHRVK